MGRTTEKPPTGTVPRIPEADSFEHRGRTIQIVRQDCIDFLRSLPDSSVDLIVTDPAYSGMNRKLKLGHGRIVGKYQNRGEGGKWFKEFDDTEENYSAFLSECRRILRDEVGHIYIMFDSFSLLSLGAIVREYFDVKNLLVWDKVHFGMGHYYRRRHEFIIFGTSGNTRRIKINTFFTVENGELVEYQRSGSCKQCGECCCKHTINYQMQVFFVHHDSEEETESKDQDWDNWEGWSIFYAQGSWWYFRVTEITDEPDICKNLTEDKKCSIWKDPLKFKPVCRYWPWNPNNLKYFSNCGYTFEKKYIKDE